MLYAADLVTQYIPWYYLVSQSIKNLQLPHWIGSIYGSGYPLLAQGETGVLSPINFLAVMLLPFPLSINFLYFVYGAIALSGVYFFLKLFKLDRLSCLLGAIVYILSGFFLSRYFQPSIIFTASLLPWGFYIIKKSQVNEKNLIFLAPLIFLQITAGHLQIAFISACAYLSYAALNKLFFQQKLRVPIKILTFLLLGIALAGIQLFPSAKLFKMSQRKNWDRNILFSYSLPPSHLITYINPGAFGISRPGDDFGFRQFGGGFWEINITIWSLPFILSLLPVFLVISKKIKQKGLAKTIIIFYLIWAAFILLSLGGFFKPNLIFAKIPNYPFRAPARFMLVSTFVASILCAVGFNSLMRYFPKKLFYYFAFFAIIIVSLLQIFSLMHNYFIFRSEKFIVQDIKNNIEKNRLWTPLILEKDITSEYPQAQMRKIFIDEFKKGLLISFSALLVLLLISRISVTRKI